VTLNAAFAVAMCVASCAADGAPPPDALSLLDSGRPLKAWMESDLATPLRRNDFATLAARLDVLARAGSATFPLWGKLATAGARAAASRDADGVRANCAECHRLYRATYRRLLAREQSP
jgi:hypothetical protein